MIKAYSQTLLIRLTYHRFSWGQGSVELETMLPDGEVSTCVLKKVLWVPELSHNVVSIPAAVRNGNSAQFSGNTYTFKDKKGEYVAQATLRDDLYYLNFCTTRISATTLKRKHLLPRKTDCGTEGLVTSTREAWN